MITAKSGSLMHYITIPLTVTTSQQSQPPQQSSVTVQSVDSSNSPINGFYTVLYQNGAATNSGFTPATFSTTSGQQYTVEVQDYGSYYFNHWSDTGSTNRDRTFTAISSSMVFTAAYSTSPPSGGSGGGSNNGVS
jgi:hypothetical protein